MHHACLALGCSVSFPSGMLVQVSHFLVFRGKVFGVSVPVVVDLEQCGGDAQGMSSTTVQCFNSAGRGFSGAARWSVRLKGVVGIDADGRRSRAMWR